jgi:hypothetical protein
MSELERIDLSQLDLSRTDYRTKAMSSVPRQQLRGRPTLSSDLQQARLSEKRAVETDYGRQTDLWRESGSFPKVEVLGVGVRLGTRAKIMRG